MRNKEDFEALLKMGYSVSEALALLPEDQEAPKEAQAAQPDEPKQEPKPEPKQEVKEEPKPKPEESADFFTSMNASMSNIMNAIDKLTKAVQYNNRMTAGTDEDPNQKKADEFLKNLLEGRN